MEHYHTERNHQGLDSRIIFAAENVGRSIGEIKTRSRRLPKLLLSRRGLRIFQLRGLWQHPECRKRPTATLLKGIHVFLAVSHLPYARKKRRRVSFNPLPEQSLVPPWVTDTGEDPYLGTFHFSIIPTEPKYPTADFWHTTGC